MSDILVQKCDVPGCKRIKGEANHWYMYFSDGPYFYALRYDDGQSQGHKGNYACGDEHLHLAMSKHFAQVKGETENGHGE